MHEEPRDADGERPNWRSCTISGGRSKRDDQRFLLRLFLRLLQGSTATVNVLVLSGARRGSIENTSFCRRRRRRRKIRFG